MRLSMKIFHVKLRSWRKLMHDDVAEGDLRPSITFFIKITANWCFNLHTRGARREKFIALDGMRHESEFPMVNAIVKVSQRHTQSLFSFSYRSSGPYDFRLISFFAFGLTRNFGASVLTSKLPLHRKLLFWALFSLEFLSTAQTRMSPENFHTMNEPRACKFKSFIDEPPELWRGPRACFRKTSPSFFLFSLCSLFWKSSCAKRNEKFVAIVGCVGVKTSLRSVSAGVCECFRCFSLAKRRERAKKLQRASVELFFEAFMTHSITRLGDSLGLGYK